MPNKFAGLIEEKYRQSVRTDLAPTEGYLVEVDGKLKGEFPILESALQAGAELKKKFPAVRIVVYDAKACMRIPIE